MSSVEDVVLKYLDDNLENLDSIKRLDSSYWRLISASPKVLGKEARKSACTS